MLRSGNLETMMTHHGKEFQAASSGVDEGGPIDIESGLTKVFF